MSPLEVYMCGVDFQHEFGETDVRTFASAEQLKEKTKCWKSCGIVKVTLKIEKVEWIEEQDLFRDSVVMKDKKDEDNSD